MDKSYKEGEDKIQEVGEQTLCRLKSPHIIGYRSDKTACIFDVGLNQINGY